eukprot:scaffold295907_cov19-Tisochrysis_lutea.AAC.1
MGWPGALRTHLLKGAPNVGNLVLGDANACVLHGDDDVCSQLVSGRHRHPHQATLRSQAKRGGLATRDDALLCVCVSNLSAGTTVTLVGQTMLSQATLSGWKWVGQPIRGRWANRAVRLPH